MEQRKTYRESKVKRINHHQNQLHDKQKISIGKKHKRRKRPTKQTQNKD